MLRLEQELLWSPIHTWELAGSGHLRGILQRARPPGLALGVLCSRAAGRLWGLGVSVQDRQELVGTQLAFLTLPGRGH